MIQETVGNWSFRASNSNLPSGCSRARPFQAERGVLGAASRKFLELFEDVAAVVVFLLIDFPTDAGFFEAFGVSGPAEAARRGGFVVDDGAAACLPSGSMVPVIQYMRLGQVGPMTEQ